MSTALVPTARWAAKARTPRSAPGNKRNTIRGFTLIELMVVITLIAIAAGLISLSLRDPASTQLENEAARLVALLESARAESRSSGIPVQWEPRHDPQNEGFQFKGLVNDSEFPNNWLDTGVSAEIVGATAITLGPEPFIPPQRIVLRLEDQRLALATDGLGPFAVMDNDSTSSP